MSSNRFVILGKNHFSFGTFFIFGVDIEMKLGDRQGPILASCMLSLLCLLLSIHASK